MRRRKPKPRRRWGRAARPPRLLPEHRGWLQEGLLRGREPGHLIEDLVAATGMPAPAAERALERIARDDLDRLDEMAPIVRRLEQRELVLRLLREARRTGAHRSDTIPVPQRARLDAETFFDTYYAALQPVLLTEQIADWPALERWRLPALAARFPDLEVEICDGRDRDPDYDMRFAEHCNTVTLSKLVARIEATPQSNDFYMVANNRNLERSALRALLEDTNLPPFLDPRRRDGWCSLWVGPGGTQTPLHHDLTSILFCQIEGRKRIHLVPPYELSPLADARGVYAARNADARDAGLRAEIEVAPGQALFIPIGWWHQVEALTPSVSISFTNFRRSNRWGWYRPGER